MQVEIFLDLLMYELHSCGELSSDMIDDLETLNKCICNKQQLSKANDDAKREVGMEVVDKKNEEKWQLQLELRLITSKIIVGINKHGESNTEQSKEASNRQKNKGKNEASKFTQVETHWKFNSDGTFVTNYCRVPGTWKVKKKEMA